MTHILPTGICHNPWQSEPLVSIGISSFSGFRILNKAVSWTGPLWAVDRRGNPPALPHLGVLLGSVTQCQTKPWGLHFPQVGDVHHVLLCLCRYQKVLCRSSFNSMKAVSCSLVRAKYLFFHFFCWFGVAALWKRIFTVLLALLKWVHRHNNSK